MRAKLGTDRGGAITCPRMIGLCVAWACTALAPLPTAIAQDEPRSLWECVERAFASTKLTVPVRADFLLTGDHRVYAHRFERDECLFFFAAGARHAQDIELKLQSEDGSPLARGKSPSTLPSARHCGSAGERVLASVRMLDGQGEVAYAVAADSGAGSAMRELERCPWVGAPRPRGLDVGPEPRARSIAEELDHAGAELVQLGFRPDRVVGYGALEAGQHEARGLVLDTGRCYALLAVGSSGVIDLDMRVFGPSPVPVAVDASRKRNALVKFCASAPARYVLDVGVFHGEGAYAVQAFVLPDPPGGVPPGITGSARIGYAENFRRMYARGMLPVPITSGIVLPGDSLSVPVQLSAQQCYALCAIAADGVPSGSLEVALTSTQGELLAHDARRDREPLIFHCVGADETRHAVVRARDARAPARFMLFLGRAPKASAPDEVGVR